MQTETLIVENLKCGGCANTIRNKLSQDFENVSVDVDSSAVTFSFTAESGLDKARAVLQKLGYPVAGTELSTMADLKAKTTSFVSCATGRLSS
ncbi:MAG: heavy-metal-associated domain-containing protein [Leptospiraceae bacterium]|nr:heavy-metal-associated domain-containing protein [Leptospiraceae bacterium]